MTKDSPHDGARQAAGFPAAAAVGVWSAALLIAPFHGEAGVRSEGAPWLWGIGSALLLCVFPVVLVAVLQRRNDLSRWAAAAPTGPVVLGAVAVCFILLRLILWLDGPLATAAAIFAFAASVAAGVLLQRAAALDNGLLVFCGGAAAAAVLFSGLASVGPLAWIGWLALAAAATAGVFCPDRMFSGRKLAAASMGALLGAGVPWALLAGVA
ncbi:hypothetical protein [Arthrobacter sp. 7Tela_A1]|uniref:hypothetical protein n=1 Tax=Arthrobacter sp. 7Tela_A1 TaxID=3093745 RepID=UPI003BB48A41